MATKDGVFVILPFGEGHIWMVRHNYGERQWSLPGGGVEAHQDFESAALAECHEETGFEVQLLRQLGKFTGRISNSTVELWQGIPKRGFNEFSGQYDREEIQCQGIIPWDLSLDFPVYRAQRLFLQVFKLISARKLEVPVVDWMSAPFKSKPIQNWFDNLSQERRSK